MPKRKCSFNADLRAKYPFIKLKSEANSSDVVCEKCRTEFSVAHGGSCDVEKHLKSHRHVASDQAACSSKSISLFFKSNVPSKKDLEVSAAEGVWAYHTVRENHSFRSNYCASKVISTCFEPKFHCARTKSQAIVTQVFAPLADSQLKRGLENANYVSLMTDASNHGSQKILPVLVRYFDKFDGVKVKILDLRSQPGETSEIIVSYLKDLLRKHNLTDKIISFSGDNTNCMFGGAGRKGTENVYRKLETFLQRDIVGIGCASHIIHNAILSASDCLPVDVEVVVVKIYSHFYIYTVRVEKFKEICDTIDIDYQKMLGYSKTQWLALMPGVERILKLYLPLKEYFLSQPKCPVVLKTFFEDEHSLMWLYFIHSQAATFQNSVLKVEGQNVSAIEVTAEIKTMKEILQNKIITRFIPHVLRNLMTNNCSGPEKEDFTKTIVTFYETSLQYLEQWTTHFEDLEMFEWATLKKNPEWSDVQLAVDYLIDKKHFDASSDTELFDEMTCVNKYIENHISVWNDNKLESDKRWLELLKHLRENSINHQHISKIAEYVLALPGSNAAVERVFSALTKVWTSEKTQLRVSILRSILVTKINFDLSCQDFYSMLRSSPALLKQISSNTKYEYDD